MIVNNHRLSPRVFIAVGLSVFVFMSFLLYASMDTDTKSLQNIYGSGQMTDFVAINEKITDLKRQLNENNKILVNLYRNLEKQNPDLAKQSEVDDLNLPQQISMPKNAEMQKELMEAGKKSARLVPLDGNEQCPVKTAQTDMLDAYVDIPFDNEDGGVWKQGFDIKYDKKKIQEEKRLEVVVVPHSHCDPGWLSTFEEYYEAQTQNILNGMLEHLSSKPDLKFIYAEMSFFELWWSHLTEAEREKTRSLLKTGQLEIVTGGWVMTDEANSRTFSIVMELIEGHEFLINHLNYRPKSHWSIDPFGLSATLAKVVQAANLTHMAVQRVHYSIKKFLATTKQLEFRWRQLYAGSSAATDIRTHMFPFYSYDVPHTCGPDPSICCQFDFRRFFVNPCPWGKNPQPITSRNVAARAQILADQYRKKAQLYKLNTLLVPLGDDFRYDTDIEWKNQYTNYKKLFEYMNKQPHLNINARFGTLSDYFKLLDERLAESDQKDLPILSGDFFTYADRDDHYWSGYFTSRPFYKHMDRTVQHFVRSADLLFSLASWKMASNGGSLPLLDDLYNMLVQSRRSLSLFQHHDGVTGTARDYVMLDYGKKMLNAIESCATVITSATNYLLGVSDTATPKLDFEYYVEELPKQLKVLAGSSLLLHNSLGHERHEVKCVLVESLKSRVQLRAGAVRQQIQPHIEVQKDAFIVVENEYELCFEARLPALGFARFQIVEGDDTNHAAKVQVSGNTDARLFDDAITLSPIGIPTFSNAYLEASFDPKSGYLKSVQYANETKIGLELDFLYYGVRARQPDKGGSDSISGAYLFLPDGPAKPLSHQNNSFVIIKGDVCQLLLLKGPSNALVFQRVQLVFNSPYLDIVNQVDVRSTVNFELSMRIKSPEMAGDAEQFYTDLNGFQMIRRKRFEKLPLQAHFYPMTTAAFIDTSSKRLTLLGRQSLGVASLSAGQIEVILDRRLMQDDNRGLAQGVSDNKQTMSHFRLLLESTGKQPDSDRNRAGFLSARALQASHSLNYPLMAMQEGQHDSSALSTWSALKKPLPCDTHLFAFRTLSDPTIYDARGQRQTKPRREALLILERAGVECSITNELSECEKSGSGKLNLADYFAFTPRSVRISSLTGMYDSDPVLAPVQLDLMDLRAVKLEF